MVGLLLFFRCVAVLVFLGFVELCPQIGRVLQELPFVLELDLFALNFCLQVFDEQIVGR